MSTAVYAFTSGFAYLQRDRTLAWCAAAFGASTFMVLSYLFFDVPLAALCRLDHSHPVYLGARFLSKFGQAHYFLLPALVLGAGFWWTRRDIALRAWYLFCTVALSSILATIVKTLSGRARPDEYFKAGEFGFYGFSTEGDYASFPSGHAVVFFSGFTALAILFPRYRTPLLLAAALLSLTRVVLGMHYPSDVMAGAVLAMACAYLLARRWKLVQPI